MAIRVLLDHGVQQDRIVFVTFLVAQGGGITVLRKAFPDIHIVCAAVDDEMDEGWSDSGGALGKRKIWLMQPGMGQIGNSSHLLEIRLSDGPCRGSVLPVVALAAYD